MAKTNHIYITESASVGSIGVYLALLDRSEAMKARGDKLQLFKAGKFKAMGFPGTTLTEEESAMLQATVDKAYTKFTSAVTSSRPGVQSAAMQGQMFTGSDARDAKLVDALVLSFASLVRKLG